MRPAQDGICLCFAQVGGPSLWLAFASQAVDPFQLACTPVSTHGEGFFRNKSRSSTNWIELNQLLNPAKQTKSTRVESH